MTFFPHILGRRQHTVLKRLGPLARQSGFYLAGGTAIALQLGHRRSLDLDWFTGSRLEEPLRLADHLTEKNLPFRLKRLDAGTLQGDMSRMRVSFFEYRYPLLKPLGQLHAFDSQSASLADLAAMKLSAIAQRGAKKDFVDVYAIGCKVANLDQMLKWYQQKFGVRDVTHLLVSLAYFDDADREPTPSLIWRVDWRTIKRTISEWLRELTG